MNLETLKRLWNEVQGDIAPDTGALAVATLLRAHGSARLPELRFALRRAGVADDEQMGLLAHLVDTGAIVEGRGDEYLPAGAKPETPAERAQQFAESDEPGRHLAHFYAGVFNLQSATGKHPSADDLHRAHIELSRTDYLVDYDPRSGQWNVYRTKKEPGVRSFAEKAGVSFDSFSAFAERAPKNGVQIGPKFYRGGQWIPNSQVEKATPEERAKIDHAKAEHVNRRKARGHVDAEALKARLAPHTAEPLDKHTQKSANLAFAALHRHHGELTIHRLEELAEQLERGLSQTPPDEEGISKQFRQRLAALHGMIGKAQAKGVTGKVLGAFPAPTKPAFPNLPQQERNDQAGPVPSPKPDPKARAAAMQPLPPVGGVPPAPKPMKSEELANGPQAPAAQPTQAAAAKHIQTLAAQNRGQVSLADLREALGSPPVAELHRLVNELRQSGAIEGVSWEGRHGAPTPREHESMIVQPSSRTHGGGDRLVHVAVRDPGKLAEAINGKQAAAAPTKNAILSDLAAFNKRDERTGLTPLVPALYDQLRQKHPGLTEPEFHDLIGELHRTGKATLQRWDSSVPFAQSGYAGGRFPLHPQHGRVGWITPFEHKQ